MINISDELNAATEQGVLGRASQIKDTTQNKMQSQINAEVQAALAQTDRIDDIRQIVRDAVGPGATADFESDEGLQVGNFRLAFWNDGDWYIDTDHTTDLDDLEVGSVVKVTALPSGEEFHVPASVDTSNLYIDSESHQIYGITGDPIPVQVGHTYRVTGIYATIGDDIIIYTYEEVADSVTDLVESITAKILDAIGDIDIDTTALAKQSNVGTSSDQASESGSSLFAVLKAVWNKVVNIYNALTDGTNGLSAIKNAIPSVSGLATETSVKDGNDTAIGLLKDQTNGLTAIKNSAASAATDAAAAKVAAQAITGYATEANATANKNAIIAEIQANAGIPTLTIPDSTAAQELAPNVLYIFSTRTSTLTLTLGTPIVGIANEYHFFIVCGSTAPTVNFPSGISWNGGSAPTIAADKTYEVSILNNVAAYFEV